MSGAQHSVLCAFIALAGSACMSDHGTLRMQPDGGAALGIQIPPSLSAESLALFRTVQVGDLLLSTDGQIVVAVDARKRRLEVFRLSAEPGRVLEPQRAPTH